MVARPPGMVPSPPVTRLSRMSPLLETPIPLRSLGKMRSGQDFPLVQRGLQPIVAGKSPDQRPPRVEQVSMMGLPFCISLTGSILILVSSLMLHK